MRVTFTQVGGWSGGMWLYDGLSWKDFKETYAVDPKPVEGMTATVTRGYDSYKVVIDGSVEVSGVDHDHGHQYPWSYNEPTFRFPGNPFSIPASEIWRLGFEIALEVS